MNSDKNTSSKTISNKNVTPLKKELNHKSPIQEKLDYLHTIGFRTIPLPHNKKGAPPAKYKDQSPNCQKHEYNRNSNIGIPGFSFGSPDEELSLFIIDVDNKPDQHNRNGIQDYADLKRKFNLPDTYTVESPNCGYHYYYYVNYDLIRSLLKTVPKHPPGADGIDLLTYKHYAVAPYSELSSDGNSNVPRIYKPIDPYKKVQKIPTNFLEYLAKHSNSNSNSHSQPSDSQQTASQIEPGVIVDSPENINNAISYIDSTPISTFGGRNNTLYEVASDVKRLGISLQVNKKLLQNYNYTKCQPPIIDKEYNTTIESVYKNNPNKIGSDSKIINPDQQAQQEFESILPQSKSDLNSNPELQVTKSLTVTNHRLISSLENIAATGFKAKSMQGVTDTIFGVMINNEEQFTYNVLESKDPEHRSKLRQIRTSYMKESAIKRMYSSVQLPYITKDDRYKDKSKKSLVNIIQIAIEKETIRRCPLGTIFSPGKPKVFNNTFNEWNGHPYKALSPKEIKDLSDDEYEHFNQVENLIFEEYINKVLCKSDQSKYEYITSWLGKKIQQPQWKPQVSLAFYGNKGTGKSFLTEKLMFNLIGRQYCIQYSDPEALTKSFNAEQEYAQLIALEEMISGSQHKNRQMIKSLVTEEDRLIEQKGVDKKTVKNYFGLILTSNNDHCIPAEFNERRYTVMEVSNSQMQNRPFFKSLLDILDKNHGVGWLYLYTLFSDLSILTVDPDEALETEELTNQILETTLSDDPLFAFVYEYATSNMKLDANHDARMFNDDDIRNMTDEEYEKYITDPNFIWPQEPHDLFMKAVFENFKRHTLDKYGKRADYKIEQYPLSKFTRIMTEIDGSIGCKNYDKQTNRTMPLNQRHLDKNGRSRICICPPRNVVIRKLNKKIKVKEHQKERAETKIKENRRK